MKYILLNDLSFFRKKFLKKFILYCIALIGSFNVLKLTNGYMNFDIFYNTIGINYSNDLGSIEKLLCIFNILFYFYLSLELFTKELKNGVENIFLRINTKKFIINKLISISIITILINIIIYILFLYLFIINKILISNILIVFLKNIIYVLTLQFSIIIVYMFSKNNKCILFLLMLFIFMFNNRILINIINTKIIYLILVLIFILWFIVMYFKKNYFNLFEK